MSEKYAEMSQLCAWDYENDDDDYDEDQDHLSSSTNMHEKNQRSSKLNRFKEHMLARPRQLALEQ